MVVSEIGLGVTLLSLAIWIYLLCFRGQFWRCDRCLTEQATDLENLPAVCAVIPARNEAEMLPMTLRSLLAQSYSGFFTVILVDDHSTDGTADVAHAVGASLGINQADAQTTSDNRPQLHIISAQPLPPGWTGKLWALEQGIRHVQTLTLLPDYFLLTDADIEHDANNLRRLVAKAQQEDLDLVSLMVRLRCESFWEQLLIPAFVFFFQKLYPFRWVNDSTKPTAAAAGGCILIRREALTRIGGIQVVRGALIDDCALAQAVKSNLTPPTPLPYKGRGEFDTPLLAGEGLGERSTAQYQKSNGRIWLGLSDLTRSLRPYPTLATIWDMVARTAFYQLKYSPWLLLGTVMGMTIIYVVPPVAVVFGVLTGNWLIAIAALITWLLMAFAYFPTIRYYHCSPWLAFCLPAIAFLYTLMTLDSARRHWRRQGGAWKGRVYSDTLGNG